MSKGPGSVQRWIVETLAAHENEPASTATLYVHFVTDFKKQRHRRSARHSLTRALRNLEAAGTIKRDGIDKHWTLVNGLKPTDRLIATAFHEAGHAVAHIWKQVPLAFVTINPGRDYLGVAAHAWLGPNHTTHTRAAGGTVDSFGNPVKGRTISQAEHEGHVYSSIAGPMANCLILDENPAEWRKRHASPSDIRNAQYGRRNLDKPKSWAEYERETLDFLRQHWSKVEAVANALLKRKTLNGFEVENICARISRRAASKSRR